jgi:hypothetical protein
MKKIYNNKYFPRLFYIKPDGGKDSGVTAYFLIEWKILFSIGILYFKKGSREAYHTHAFNALTWWLKGKVTECKLNASFNGKGDLRDKYEDIEKVFKPSLIPKYTSRNNFHKVFAHSDTWALTFRSNWKDTWLEFKDNKIIRLTHGRNKITE